MKTILLTIALVACMTLITGCSKSDDDPTPQYKLTKDNIVGVWRSGDYWVSFSEDGYSSLYFSVNGDERILEGDYTIKGDTITVEHTMYYDVTKIVIDDISPSSLHLTILYSYYPFTVFENDRNKIIKVPVSLTKSAEIPTEKIAGIDGIVYENNLHHEENGETYLITQTNTIYEKEHCIRYINDYHGNIPPHYQGVMTNSGLKYYVYLSPYLYTSIGEYFGRYERNQPILKYLIQPQ